MYMFIFQHIVFDNSILTLYANWLVANKYTFCFYLNALDKNTNNFLDGKYEEIKKFYHERRLGLCLVDGLNQCNTIPQNLVCKHIETVVNL